MARVPEEEIARIKSAVSIARLAEAAGVQLRPQGQDLVGCCPFHDDSTPSLVISPASNLWHCLGECAAGGSVIDWVMRSRGVSFRLAVELLRADAPSLSSPPRRAARSRAMQLEPLQAAEDAGLLAEVTGFYHDALAGSAEAAAFLHRRKIADPEAVGYFRIGFCDRTLGYRLPHSRTAAGAEVRPALRRLGILRSSGHEHFRGCLVIPVISSDGVVGEVYGRRVDDHLKAGVPRHLYLPGPHRGVLNPAAFTAGSGELIVCESLIDAVTLWCAGFAHVTASYGTGGWTAEHTAAVREQKVSRVLIAYDGDPAGDAGAASLAAELSPLGTECLRVPLPDGADINDIAVHARSPRDALGVLLRHAAPAGGKPAPRTPGAQRTRKPATRAGAAGDDAGAVAGAAQAARAGGGARPKAPPAPEDTGPQSVPGQPGAHGDPPVLPGGDRGPDGADARGGELAMTLGERRWRVRGLDRVTGHGALRVNVLAALGEAFHIDTLDLYSARARQAFITAAAAELGTSTDIVRSDLGKVLLASESAAEQAITAARTPHAAQPVMTEAERAAALELLTSPDLTGRITADFAAAGIAGEAAAGAHRVAGSA